MLLSVFDNIAEEDKDGVEADGFSVVFLAFGLFGRAEAKFDRRSLKFCLGCFDILLVGWAVE